MTEEQRKRAVRDWSAIAGEPVRVEKIGGAIYGFTSELGALRLFHKFSAPEKCRAEFSKNLNTWFFSTELFA